MREREQTKPESEIIGEERMRSNQHKKRESDYMRIERENTQTQKRENRMRERGRPYKNKKRENRTREGDMEQTKTQREIIGGERDR